MANWDNIRSTAKKTAGKAIKKTGELADLAGMHIRLKSLEAKRDAQYKQLGKLTYRQMKTGESMVSQIAPIIEKLDELRERIRLQVAQIEAEKAARKARKNAEEEPIVIETPADGEPEAEAEATEKTAE